MGPNSQRWFGDSTRQGAKVNLDPSIRYHLGELEIAENPDSPLYSMPEFLGDETVLLDVGCGVGQTFAASQLQDRKLLVGVDIDHASMAFGQGRFPFIRFANASAESLPFKAGTFDVVSSRVSLPYTHVPTALTEIHRVLRPGGRLWATLHPLSLTLGEVAAAVKCRQFKGLVFRQYVIANGLVFHFTGRQFSFPLNGRYESFQTANGMRRALARVGFDSIDIVRDGRLTIIARKSGTSGEAASTSRASATE